MTAAAGPPPGVASTPAAAAAAAAAALAGVEVISLPDLLLARLAAAARGLVISGTVAGREGTLVHLRTAAGEIMLRTAEPLPIGRLATLQIPPRPPGEAAPPPAIVGRLWIPLAPAIAPTTGAAAPGPAASTPPMAPPAAPAPATPGAMPAAPAGGQPAAIGMPVLVNPGAVPVDPLRPVLPAATVDRPSPAAPSGAARQATSVVHPAWPAVPNPPGIAHPSNTAPALPPAPSSGQAEPQAAPRAGAALQSALALGSAGAAAAPLHEPGEGRPPFDTPIPRPTAVGDLLSRLAGADPEAAGRSAAALPRPGERLATAVLQLIGALPSPPDDGFPGRAALAAMQRAGADDLPARLAAELAPTAMRSADPVPADWRVFTLPILADDRLAAFRLAVRRREDESRGGGGATRQPHRFLIDLDLSRLGPLQFDGLVRKPRFDLLLRAVRPLPAPIRAEIIGVFEDACAACGLDGALTFRFGPRGWIRLAGLAAEAPVMA